MVDLETWVRTARFRAVIAAVFLALPTGFWGVFVLFSNGMQGIPYVLFVSVTHFLPSVLVGAVARPAWYIALIGAWGGLFWGTVPLLSSFSNVNSPFIEFVVIPVSVGLGGLVGSLDSPIWSRLVRPIIRLAERKR